MEWYINIEDKPDQRIRVEFKPEEEILCFIGQYKIKYEWIKFSEVQCPMRTNVETIQSTIFETFEFMNERINAYKNIAEGFNLIKVIQIVKE